jgi:hypothetical protein
VIRLAPGQSTIIHNELSRPCPEYVPIQNVSVRGQFTVEKPAEAKPAEATPPVPPGGPPQPSGADRAPAPPPTSSHPVPSRKLTRRSAAAIRRDQQRERQRQRVASLEEQQRREREQLQQATAGLQKTMNDLAAAPVPEGIRHAEIGVHVPMGWRGKEAGGSAAELGASFGVRLELRLFSWGKAGATRAPTGNGFEFAIAGGVAGGKDTGATFNGFSRLRLWRGPVAIGVFADVDRNHRAAGSTAVPERSMLLAVGPELALGIATKRTLTAEIGGRLGTVGTWPPSFSFDTTGKDLYFSGYAVAGVNMMYAGAVATRYHNLTQAVQASWVAAGIVGVRLPF